MRISSRMFQQRAISTLRASQQSLYKAQNRAASGRRIQTISDDPDAASRIMRLNGQLRDIEQFQQNATEAQTRLQVEDTAITTARDLLARVRALAVSISSDDPANPDRVAAQASLEQIRQQLVALGNTRVSDGYLFGGACSTTPPFQPDGSYVGDDTVHQAVIDNGLILDTNHTGNDLFGEALQAIQSLQMQVRTGTAGAIQSCLPEFDGSTTGLLAAQAEVGARLQQAQTTSTSLALQAANLADTRDALQGSDPTEAAVEVIAAQSALERAYAAIGKILSTNLLDYLS